MRRLVPVAVLIVLLTAGCGGEVVTPTPETVVGKLPKTLDDMPGKALFKSKGCTACHTLEDAGATGTVGPNLDEKKPPAALVITRVTDGKGAMPPFKGQLTPQQIKDVADYIVAATRSG